jgi:PD-(D/E)XK nuclease superfamily protein
VQHPKDIGDRSTLAIVLALNSRGFATYMPFGQNTRCDLILDDGAQLSRVQCKTGRLRNGSVLFKTCSTYAHHRHPKIASRTYEGEIDKFAVFCPELGSVYLIPIADVPATSKAALRVDAARNGQRRGIRPAAAYEVARVALRLTRREPDAPAGA